MANMSFIYYKLIKACLKTIDDVPENLKIEVQVLLDADNVA